MESSRKKQRTDEGSRKVLSLESLPSDIICEIFGYLNLKQKLRLRILSKHWCDLTQIPQLWSNLDFDALKSKVPYNAAMQLLKLSGDHLEALSLHFLEIVEQYREESLLSSILKKPFLKELRLGDLTLNKHDFSSILKLCCKLQVLDLQDCML